MASPTLTAIVTAHNEEANLPDCLAALAFADELIVVLDRCTDGSKAIAEGVGAVIIEGAWPLEAERRHAGIDRASSDWVIEIDADERVPEALAQEIMAEIAKPDAADHYLIPFDNYIGARRVRYGWGAYIGVQARITLYRNGAKRWGAEKVHPSFEMTGSKGYLNGRIIHYVDDNISDLWARLDRYTSTKARDLRESGDLGPMGPYIRRIFTRFFKCYVQRKGYREGAWGFLIALAAGLYPILSYLKARLEDEAEQPITGDLND